jgi:hypothetical protein
MRAPFADSLPRVRRAAAQVLVLAIALGCSSLAGAQDTASSAAYPPDPNATRLFFGPTGRSLPQGGGYAGLYGFVLPFVQVGVTDRISLGGGTPPIIPLSSPAFWITPKVQIVRGPSVQAAIGLVHATFGGDESLGAGYGVATFGSDGRAVTFGAGWGYSRDEGGHGDAVLVLIGAERRVSRRTKLITENYITSGGPLLMGGVRMIGDRFSADLAMAVIASGHDSIAFPLVNVVCRFGRD